MGWGVGANVGSCVGKGVGGRLGLGVPEGTMVGWTVMEGCSVGTFVGNKDGKWVGFGVLVGDGEAAKFVRVSSRLNELNRFKRLGSSVERMLKTT